jgi:hypothetical protein
MLKRRIPNWLARKVCQPGFETMSNNTKPPGNQSRLSPLRDLKFRAEKDRTLSDGAYRTLSLIVSERYMLGDLPETIFPLPWSTFKSWICRTAFENRIRELEDRGYLKKETLKGCPATWNYVFVFRCAPKHASRCAGKPASSSTHNNASGCAPKHAHHISNALKSRDTKKKRRGAARTAGAATPPQTGKGEAEITRMKNELRASVGMEPIK